MTYIEQTDISFPLQLAAADLLATSFDGSHNDCALLVMLASQDIYQGSRNDTDCSTFSRFQISLKKFLINLGEEVI